MSTVLELDTLASAELVSQREFPTLATVIAGLTFTAIRLRNATNVEITLNSMDEFILKDNGRCMNVDELRSTWRSICGVANIQIDTWPGRKTMLTAGEEVNALSLANGWISFLSEDHPSNGPDTSHGSVTRVFDLFARLPVRRRLRTSQDPGKEARTIRSQLERIILLVPNVSLRCNLNHGLVLSHTPRPSTLASFASIYGEASASQLASVVVPGASALISKGGAGLHHSKELQLVFFKHSYDCALEDVMKDCLNSAFRARAGRSLMNLTSQRNRTMYLAFVICFDATVTIHSTKAQLKSIASSILDVGGWIKPTSHQEEEEHSAGTLRRAFYPETPLQMHSEKQQGRSRTEPPRTSAPMAVLGHRDSMKLNRDVIANAELVGQVNDEFIVLKRMPEGDLLIVDQHAADERVRFERFQSDTREAHQLDDIVMGKADSSCLAEEASESSKLHESPLLRITRWEREQLERATEQCESWGYRWRFESELQVLVERVPILHGAKLGPQSLLEIINNLDDTSALPLPFRRMLASKACRGAIMFGQPLAVDECERLIKNLSVCELPFQCAHGRPSVVPASTQLY